MKAFRFIPVLLTLAACSPAGELKFSESSALLNAENQRKLEAQKFASVDLVMGDRNYVESVLRDVFGTTSIPDIQSAKEFGGHCDRYATIRIASGNSSIPEYRQLACPSNGSAVSPSVTNAARYAIMTKTCDQLIFGTSPDLYSNVMKKINGTKWKLNSAEPSHKPNTSNIKTAYEQFFQDEVPTPEVVEALLKVGQTKTEIDDQWKLILMTLCISPEWQAI